MVRVVRPCVNCGLRKSRNDTSACKGCGHESSHINVAITSSITPRGDLKYKSTRQKDTGGKRTIASGKVGSELHADTKTWQFRRRQLNHEHPEHQASYQEEINNPAIGFYKLVISKLSKHRGHGSDRKKD